MTLLARTTLFMLAIALPLGIAPFGMAQAQPTTEQLAARCNELGAIFDKLGTRRGEGSGGPDMTRMGASLDCQKGRYAQGIKALEDLLKRNRISYPPAPY